MVIEEIEKILKNSKKSCVLLDEMAYILGVLPQGSQEDPQWWKERDMVCFRLKEEALKSPRIEEGGGGFIYKKK